MRSNRRSFVPVLLGQFIGNFNNFGIFYFLRGGHISMSKKWKFGRMMDTGITYLILTAVAFVFFFPCLWLILASFSKSGTIYSFNGFFPKEYSFASFQKLFTDTTLYNYPRWFFNTLFVSTESWHGNQEKRMKKQWEKVHPECGVQV